MGVEEHRAHGKRVVRCALLTVSDTRTDATDESGQLMRRVLAGAGHAVVHGGIVPDDADRIGAEIDRLVGDPGIDAVILSGGTGIAPRDTTLEVVRVRLEREIEGFGELFRMLSYEAVGAAAMLSRATAGVARGKLVVALPGSPAAVELALGKLLVPELGHAAALLGLGEKPS